MPRLPAGTVDIIVNEATYSVTSDGVSQTIKYYLTASGKRIKASDCSTSSGYTIIDNNCTITNTYIDSTDTVLNFSLGYQTPFSISFSPLKYSSTSGLSYYINSFEPEYVLITFDYVSSGGGYPARTADILRPS